jgi:hypothetical protein
VSLLADRLLRHVLSFSLEKVTLPPGVAVLDPFHGEHASEVRRIVTAFHRKYYNDESDRLLVLGINPGRLGAGSTGLSFTDTKRCESDLGIPVRGMHTHEPSSDFFHRMIRAVGGAEHFYKQVYVHAICPLGFVREQANGKAINLNYYDDPALEAAVTPFVEEWLRTLVGCGMRTDVVLCIGTGRNAAYFTKLNERLHLFGRIVAVEHPRYVMQYKAKQLDRYIDRYACVLREAGYR